jgi:four helix bundle protein
MGIVEEEIDESLYWMEMLVESGLMKKERLTSLMDEAGQIAAMAVASIKTARVKLK